MPEEILCPKCPVCGGDPMPMTFVLPWFCQNDDCLVLAWDPRSTLEENLLDAQQANVIEKDQEEG